MHPDSTGPASYQVSDISRPGVPGLTDADVLLIHRIEKYYPSNTLRFIILPRIGLLVFDARFGMCADFAPGYPALNRANTFYEPGEDPYAVHAVPGDVAPTLGPWMKTLPSAVVPSPPPERAVTIGKMIQAEGVGLRLFDCRQIRKGKVTYVGIGIRPLHEARHGYVRLLFEVNGRYSALKPDPFPLNTMQPFYDYVGVGPSTMAPFGDLRCIATRLLVISSRFSDGVGISSSLMLRTSGEPYFERTAAFILFEPTAY